MLKIEWILEALLETNQLTDVIDNQIKNLDYKEFLARPYLHLIENQKGKQIKDSIPITHDNLGEIVVDILDDGKISGIEFLNYLK